MKVVRGSLSSFCKLRTNLSPHPQPPLISVRVCPRDHRYVVQRASRQQEDEMPLWPLPAIKWKFRQNLVLMTWVLTTHIGKIVVYGRGSTNILCLASLVSLVQVGQIVRVLSPLMHMSSSVYRSSSKLPHRIV